jgi:hypothetical protein
MLRSSHGKGARSALIRVEVPPVDELSRGVPAATSRLTPAAPAASASDAPRRARGGRKLTTFVKGDERARTAQAHAAKAQREARSRLRVLESLGLAHATPEGPVLELWPYLDDADAFARAEVERLARSVGGGEVPPNVASIVQTAALQLAGSRMLIAKGDVHGASKLGNDSRQNLLAAHELCAREAKARPQQGGDSIDRLRAQMKARAEARQTLSAAAPTTEDPHA